jgi:hypothetical protein
MPHHHHQHDAVHNAKYRRLTPGSSQWHDEHRDSGWTQHLDTEEGKLEGSVKLRVLTVAVTVRKLRPDWHAEFCSSS